MKFRESARSRIPLLRSLSGDHWRKPSSRSRSKSLSNSKGERAQTQPQTQQTSSRASTSSASQLQPADLPDSNTSPLTSSGFNRHSHDDEIPPVPSLPPGSKTPSTIATPKAAEPTEPEAESDSATPITSTQPSIAVVDYDPPTNSPRRPPTSKSTHTHHDRSSLAPAMLRRIWVKRPNGSATRVEVNNEDLVDNVRDAILLKYRNSLGRTIDSPDITLKIVSRDQLNTNLAGHERTLGPEEPIGRTLDDYFPGGQNVEDALIIELVKGKTPRPSPRPGNHHVSYYVTQDQYRPDDAARDYFPPMPAQSPHIIQTSQGPVQSMAVMAGQAVQPLPSPGGGLSRRAARPRYGRQHTSSPTIMHNPQPIGTIIGISLR
jgi:osomolarity two-component system, response regulator SSK1